MTMKVIKYFFHGIYLTIGFLFLILLAIVIVDAIRLQYLKIDGKFSENSYLIKNVNLVPMTTDTVFENRTLKIVEGVIEDLDADPTVEDFPVIDAKGRFFIPGLIDMHVHVWDEYELGLYLANGVTSVRNLWGHPMHQIPQFPKNHEDIVFRRNQNEMFFCI